MRVTKEEYNTLYDIYYNNDIPEPKKLNRGNLLNKAKQVKVLLGEFSSVVSNNKTSEERVRTCLENLEREVSSIKDSMYV